MKGELSMMGLGPGARRSGRALAGLLLAGLLLAMAGCNDDDSKVVFPEPPDPPSLPWLFDIWGSGPNDIYVVGRPGVILHYDGTTWALQELNPSTADALVAVWGSGPNDVYVAGHKGRVLHNNGSGWSAMATGTDRNFYDVGRGPNGEVYLCGERVELRRLSGGAWVQTPDTTVVYNSTGTAVVDTLLRSENPNVSLTSISDYAISGAYGAVLMPDTRPTRWRVSPIGAGESWLNASFGGPAVGDNYIASDEGKLFRLQLQGTLYSWLELSSPANVGIDAIWGLPAAGDYYFVTRDGDITRRLQPNPLGPAQITTVYNGAWWLSGIWGTAADNIWAVGLNATVLHWDGEEWLKVTVPVPASNAAVSNDTDKFGRPL